MKLSDIRKLCDEASPGPWATKLAPVRMGGAQDTDVLGPVTDMKFNGVRCCSRDAAFIAASRTLMPQMADRIEALEKRNAKLLKVAEAANRLSDNVAEFGAPTDSIFMERLDEALAELEAE